MHRPAHKLSYLCVAKISYTSCITNGILASILYWIQYSSIFLYFFSYKIVSLQEKISSNNKMSHQKGSSCNILRFPNGSLFSLYVERYTTESWLLIRKILLFRQYKKLPLLSNIDFLLEEWDDSFSLRPSTLSEVSWLSFS